MSQPSVTSYFNTRKRGASDDIRGKSKVLILDNDKGSIISEVKSTRPSSPNITKLKSSVVRNIQFDTNKSSSSPSSPAAAARPKMMTRLRATKTRKVSVEDGQVDIRESFLKMNEQLNNKEPVIVPFEKCGLLSPRKNTTPTKRQITNEQSSIGSTTPTKRQITNEQSSIGSTTPKKSTDLIDKLAKQEMSLGEIKKRLNKSSRLAELKARIDRFKECDQKLSKIIEKKNKHEQNDDDGDDDNLKPVKLKKFGKIEVEVPLSPQKISRSPMKTPTKKNNYLLSSASPQRRLLFEPKETPSSPVKSSPTKVQAYQRYQCLTEKEKALPLPYNYKFLAEVFRGIDTIAAMLFNRKEVITFTKLKPGVQQLLRRNISLEHLAQIQHLYPGAFSLKQEKVKTFDCSSKEQYELCLTPMINDTNLTSTIQLERRRIFFNILIDRVRDEHEKFLLNLEPPMIVPKDKINRWHPEFDVESCGKIEEADLPKPPAAQKHHSAQDVLEKAKNYFGCNSRMEEALERLAQKKAAAAAAASSSNDSSVLLANGSNNNDPSVVDTPPATPTCNKQAVDKKLKGIPKALLEKIRAKQAAKALDAMTRTPKQDITATRHSRLPEMAKILHNIFVTESKKTLNLNFVIEKLDNSYRTKLSSNELEEHIKLICEKIPGWMDFRIVRKIVYLHLDYDLSLAKNISKLEGIANSLLRV